MTELERLRESESEAIAEIGLWLGEMDSAKSASMWSHFQQLHSMARDNHADVRTQIADYLASHDLDGEEVKETLSSDSMLRGTDGRGQDGVE